MKRIVENALKSLLYEVVTLPKPGLVDPLDRGSHDDMDAYTFIDSSVAMTPYLEEASNIGENFAGEDLFQMFNLLRQAGIKAEKSMLKATNGVNTHKGAIFSLGIFVCARSFAQKNSQDTFEIIRKMCYNLVEHDLTNINKPHTAGENQYLKYHKAGVRELAQAGYPVVEQVSLPYLENHSGTLQEKLLDTLMLLATQVDDTTFIKRAKDIHKLSWLHQAAKKYLDLGASRSQEGRDYLNELNRIFKENHYSIGGCADLLIVTIFMALEDKKLN